MMPVVHRQAREARTVVATLLGGAEGILPDGYRTILVAADLTETGKKLLQGRTVLARRDAGRFFVAEGVDG
jgi:hypothetical protein